MVPPGAESQTLRDLFGEDLDEEVITKVTTNSSDPMSPPYHHLVEDVESRAPSSVTECGAAYTLTALRTSPDLTSKAEIITNPLDELQQQQVAREEREA